MGTIRREAFPFRWSADPLPVCERGPAHHLGNVTQLRMHHEAREAFVRSLASAAGIVTETQILAGFAIDLLAEVEPPYPAMEVWCRISHTGRSSYKVQHALVTGGEIVSMGESAFVHRNEGQPSELPMRWREILEGPDGTGNPDGN